jgi:lipid II:glycine glycyltransferase (peptidoglycan interpeptide bridge formation enzyme)
LGNYVVGAYQGCIYKKAEGKYITILSFNRELSHAMANTIKDYCVTANIRMSPYEMTDVMSFIWAGFMTNVSYTHILDLKDMNAVWNGMDLDCRNSIRKAMKDGIYIDIECDFNQILILVKKTFQRQNKKITPNSWVDKSIIYNREAETLSRCRSFVAKTKDGVPIAVVYIIWDNKRGYYALSGYDHSNAHHGASSLALWTAIEYTRNELGLREFDFEGTMLQNLEPFFRQFGGKLTPYYSVSWIDRRLKPFLTLKWFMREMYGALTSKVRVSDE